MKKLIAVIAVLLLLVGLLGRTERGGQHTAYSVISSYSN